MGGKNPPKPPPRIDSEQFLRQTQFQSRYLFECASEFYRAHVEIEDAVIAETRGDSSVSTMVETAQARFADIESVVLREIQVLSWLKDDTEGLGRWTAYCDKQLSNFKLLGRIAKKIGQVLQSETIVAAIARRRFQDSMFYDGENAEVRQLNMDFSTILLESLDYHDKFVAGENDILRSNAA